MGRIHTSHIRCVRGFVISGKVGQDKKYIEGTDRDSQLLRKTLYKGPAITPGIPGLIHQYVYSNEPTSELVAPHSKIMETVCR